MYKKISGHDPEIFFTGLFYNFWGFRGGGGIPLAAGLIFILGGPKFNPAFCAGMMACSSLTVVLNALRLRFFRCGI